MAAATIAARKFENVGSVNMVVFELTSAADTNTVDTGLSEVVAFFFTPNTAGTPPAVGGQTSISSGQIRITIDTTATADMTLTVFGKS
jgi:hypothetical protein